MQADRQVYTIRNAEQEEFSEVGKLLVSIYSNLKGFPSAKEQPGYYRMLANVGELTAKPGTEIIVAVSPENKISGAVVYFGDMQYYGSGGTATKELHSAGFRLLGVSDESRGHGIGKILTMECIGRARSAKCKQVIIHTTNAMQTAWRMYENIGFRRSEDLDFMQGELQVFGFRLKL